ncbi:ERF family protein [Paramagnetospirillum kuznetsovii]|nr:ERF family protein [Paramagnetospirillum kuznetsovii]
MTTLNIHQRLHAAMQEVTYVQKEKKNGMNYTIVSHDAVTAKVRPVLVKHGVVYYPVDLVPAQDGNRTEVIMKVRFANIDDPSDFIDVPSMGYGIDSQDKGPGKAISYAVKYALLKALGLETGDDADHDSVEHEKPKPAAKPVVVSKGATKGSDPVIKANLSPQHEAFIDHLKEDVTVHAASVLHARQMWKDQQKTIDEIKRESPLAYAELVNWFKAFTETKLPADAA